MNLLISLQPTRFFCTPAFSAMFVTFIYLTATAPANAFDARIDSAQMPAPPSSQSSAIKDLEVYSIRSKGPIICWIPTICDRLIGIIHTTGLKAASCIQPGRRFFSCDKGVIDDFTPGLPSTASLLPRPLKPAPQATGIPTELCQTFPNKFNRYPGNGIAAALGVPTVNIVASPAKATSSETKPGLFLHARKS